LSDDPLAVTQPYRRAEHRLLDLLRPGKLAEELAGRLGVSGVSGLRCREHPEMALSSILVDSCAPSVPVRRNALQSAGIVSIKGFICIVLRTGCAAQIGPAIIRPIQIAVINHLRAPDALHEQPSDMMRQVSPAIDSDDPVAVLIQ